MKLNLRKLVLGVAIATLPQLMNAQTSIVNTWQSYAIAQGGQNGNFTVEFDMVAEKINIDAAIGFQFGDATGHGDLSPIVRFNSSGEIDARNGDGYGSENVLTYTAGTSYHVEMDIDVTTNTYDVAVTPDGGAELIIGTDYGFRKANTVLDKWSIIAGDWNVADPGTHTITNMVITPVSGSPIISGIMNVKLLDTENVDVDVIVSDPLEGTISIEGVDFPSFISIVDNGDGTAIITLDPASSNFGSHDVTVKAIAGAISTETTFNVYVANSAKTQSIMAEADDATLSIGIPANTGHNELFVGNRTITHAVGGSNGIIPFILPAKPDGENVVASSLKIYVKGGSSYWIKGYIDLYALPYRAASNVIEADFYAGDFMASEGDNIGIQEKIFEKNVAVGVKDTDRFEETSNDGGVALTDYINAQYAAGAVAGDIIFLRLSPNGDLAPDGTLPEGGFAGQAYWAVASSEDVANAPVLSVEFGGSLSNESVEKSTLAIYPNPVTNGEFTVSTVGMKGAVEMTIYNVTGKLVYTRSINAAAKKATVNANLSQGLYIVKLTDGTSAKTQKITVQ